MTELAFDDKIRTNYAPLPFEIAQIRQLLAPPSREIERIDHEIALLQARRLQLSAYVADHEALISPIRQLPWISSGRFFIACIPTDQNPVMSVKIAPLLLGRICSGWRTIALSTPRLWSSIHVPEPYAKLPQYVRDGCLQLMKTWLTRSGGLPLSISFHKRHPPGSSPFLDTIVSLSSRWKHISLSGQNRIQLSRADVPILKSIEVSDYVVGDGPTETRDFFCGVAVRKVSIGTDLDPIQLPLPWAQLTALSLHRPSDPHLFSQSSLTSNLSSSTALTILAECRSLCECTLFLSPSADETIAPPSSVELPLLASLKISVIACGGSLLQQHDPLDRLLLPQLSSFALTGYRANPVGIPLSTLVSNATKLQNVEVDTTFFTRETLVTFIRLLPPCVQHLILRQNVICPNAPSFVDNDFLLLLTPPSQRVDGSDAGFLFPELDTIQLIYTAAFSDEALLGFIRARMGVHRLGRVRVKFLRYVERDILPELRSFIDEFGLSVSLEYVTSKITWNPHDGLTYR